MPETFKFDDVAGTPGGWFFTSALAEVPDDHPAFKDWRPGQPITVELRVNGHEVPYFRAIKRLFEEAQRWAHEEGARINTEKGRDITAALEKLGREVEEFVREKRRELYPRVILRDDGDDDD